MTEEFNFNLPKSRRGKNVYLGSWQLHSRLRALDSILMDDYKRNLIVGQALPLSLYSFQPAAYTNGYGDSELLLKKDELHVFLGYLKNIETTLQKNSGASASIVDYLTTKIYDLKSSLQDESLKTHPSTLFVSLFLETDFKQKNNPSQYLLSRASKLYDSSLETGSLSGNRAIIENDYGLLEKLKNI